MLIDPGETSYDLRFVLFGTPVRVHPLFWLFTAILGWDFLEDGFVFLLIWVVVCFLSILLHEFGHIWMGKVFGSDGHVVLYSFGGLAIGANDLHNRWQRVAVSLAGPLIQVVVIYLPLYLWTETLSRDDIRGFRPQVRAAIFMMMFVNLYWPLFNLLPVWPLDGGMVSREVSNAVSPGRGLRFSLGLSIAVAAFIAIHALLARGRGGFVIPYLPTSTYAAILFGLLAFQSWQLLQQARVWQTPVDDRLPWESDPDAWKRR